MRASRCCRGADTEHAAWSARLERLGARVHPVASLGSATTAPTHVLLPATGDDARRLAAFAAERLGAAVLLTAHSRQQLATLASLPADTRSSCHPPRTATSVQFLGRSDVKQNTDDDASQALPRRRILVVEDNQINQTVARRMLEQLGQTVHLAGNGIEGLAALQQTSFDLVFMDCQMPEMDGFEATHRIRTGSSDTRIPIVAMTANSLKGDRERCVAAGMNDYLSKPIRMGELARVLRQWLPVATAP